MTAPSIPSWLAGARETIAKATPGPLKYDLHRPRTGFSLVTQAVHIADVMEANSHLPREEALANAEKLLRGWNALPALCDVVEAAQEMVDTQEGWERAVAKVIKSEPGVFPRAIDRARAALLALTEVPRG